MLEANLIAKVSPGLYRGPRPTSLEQLQDLGIKRSLCLESGTYSLFHEDKFERQLPTAYDFREVYVDMSGIWTPERHDVMLALKVIMDSLTAGVSIYVHCKAGKDRTGYVIAVYRMQVCGWTYEQAVAEYKAMGLHYRFYWWIPSLKQYEVKA